MSHLEYSMRIYIDEILWTKKKIVRVRQAIVIKSIIYNIYIFIYLRKTCIYCNNQGSKAINNNNCSSSSTIEISPD